MLYGVFSLLLLLFLLVPYFLVVFFLILVALWWGRGRMHSNGISGLTKLDST
jgi:hypothetical protein